MESELYDYIFKLVIIGDSGVGKSSLTRRYIENTYSDSFHPTIGVEFGTKKMKINNKFIKLQIWDTAGQEKYKSITSAYYRGTRAVFIIYDITEKSSFDNVDNWISSVKSCTDKDVLVVMIGNKSDLSHLRKVSLSDAKSKAENNDILYYETSAKDGSNIEYVFEVLGKYIYSLYEKELLEFRKSVVLSDVFEIDNKDENDKISESKCCKS